MAACNSCGACCSGSGHGTSTHCRSAAAAAACATAAPAAAQVQVSTAATCMLQATCTAAGVPLDAAWVVEVAMSCMRMLPPQPLGHAPLLTPLPCPCPSTLLAHAVLQPGGVVSEGFALCVIGCAACLAGVNRGGRRQGENQIVAERAAPNAGRAQNAGAGGALQGESAVQCGRGACWAHKTRRKRERGWLVLRHSRTRAVPR